MGPNRLAVLAVIAACAAPLHAQGKRFAAPRANLGGDVFDSIVVDFDADGWPDLLAGAEALVLRRGLGDGSFGPIQSIGTDGQSPNGLTVLDLDLDGDLDVVASRTAVGVGPTDMFVSMQQADGGFGPLITFPCPDWPIDTLAGDLDGDGAPEIAVLRTSITVSDLRVHYATAPGVFGPTVTSSLAYGAHEAHFVDLDGDGFLDLVANGEDVVNVRLNDGAGGLGPLTTFPASDQPRGLAVSDLDGDGQLDLVGGRGALSGEIDLHYGLGDGTLEPFEPIDSGFIYPDHPAVGDLDRDGLGDIAIDTGYRLSVLFNEGARTWAAPVQHPIGGSGHEAVSLADLDLDGWLDVVVDNRWDRDATVLMADGDGAYTSMDLYEGPSTFDPAVELADYDGDGVLDVFATNKWDDTGTTWLGVGDGTFVEGPTLALTDVPWFARAGLLDGDAVPDLLLLDRTTDTARVLHGVGDGSFTYGQVLAMGDQPRTCELSDLDGDGDLDAIVANELDATLRVLHGAGDGTFTFGQLVGPIQGSLLRNFALGDVTSDGDLDLVVGMWNSDSWRVYEGNGAGFFSEYPTPFATPPTITDVELADVDADGRLDLFLLSYGDKTIWAFPGTAHTPWFGAPQVIALEPSESGPSELVFADYDLDGSLDIAVGMGGAQRIDLLFGNGAGAFDRRESYSVDETAEFIRTGDWDADGAPDLLAVAQAISVQRNHTLDPWAELGQGTPGSDGIPWLRGEGELAPGEPVSVELGFAEPSTGFALVIGLDVLNAPFKGGLMVPTPDVIVAGLVTDAQGAFSWPFAWPDLPGQPAILMQAWVTDAQGPVGFAASGGLRAIDS